MNAYFEVYSVLPDLFKIAGETWGIALPSLTLIPLTFLSLVGVGFAVFILSHLKTLKGAHLMVAGVALGGILISLGSVCEWLGAAALLESGGIRLGEMVGTVGVILLGGTLVLTTHRAFKESC